MDRICPLTFSHSQFPEKRTHKSALLIFLGQLRESEHRYTELIYGCLWDDIGSPDFQWCLAVHVDAKHFSQNLFQRKQTQISNRGQSWQHTCRCPGAKMSQQALPKKLRQRHKNNNNI